MFKWIRITKNGFDQMLEGKVNRLFLYVWYLSIHVRER